MSYLSKALKQRVREKFSACCAYCHSPEFLSNAIFEYDHIIPEAGGGETVFDNLCFCCPKCNRYKHDFQMGLDPDSNESVRLFHPQRDVWQEHFEWDDDKATLLGLTETGRATIQQLRLNTPDRIDLRLVWVEFGRFPLRLE
jgi:HNH endonuclease